MTTSTPTETRAASTPRRLLRDLMTLTKPGVTRMCALEAAGAAWLALHSPASPFSPETPADGWCSPGFAVAFAGVIGASLSVAGASALNMWLERAKDPLMARTRTRPLALPEAARRLSSGTALGFAVTLCLLSVAILWTFTNPLTAILAAWAIVGYALVYTPLKYRTPLALVIGELGPQHGHEHQSRDTQQIGIPQQTPGTVGPPGLLKWDNLGQSGPIERNGQ